MGEGPLLHAKLGNWGMYSWSCPCGAEEMREGAPDSPQQHEEVLRGGRGQVQRTLAAQGTGTVGRESGEGRPGRGWVRLRVASLRAGPGSPRTILCTFGELRRVFGVVSSSSGLYFRK